MSVEIRYGSDDPKLLMPARDSGGFMLVAPTTPDPTSLASVTHETAEMLGALQWLAEELGRDVNDTTRKVNEKSLAESAAQALQALALSVRRINRALPRFAERLPNHSPNIPTFAGVVGETYHVVALRLCDERIVWLSQFVLKTPRKSRVNEKLSEWDRAKQEADEMVSRIGAIRRTWPFDSVDLRPLIRLVRFEGQRAKPERLPRRDAANDRDLELVRNAVRSMGVREPSRDAVAAHLRKTGVGMSNSKVGAALKRLRSE